MYIMIDKVAELSHQLREVGLPVSIRVHTQLLKFIRFHEMIEIFKNSLKSNSVKDKYDIPRCCLFSCYVN